MLLVVVRQGDDGLTGTKKKRLGDLLIDSGLLDQEKLEKALTVQNKTGERLGKTLINLGYVTEESLIEVLEFQLGIPHIMLKDTKIDSDVAALIPQPLAERYTIIPIKKVGRHLTLAMTDPTNFYAIDDVRTISGLDVEPVIATEKEILRAIKEAYGVRALVDKASSIVKPEDLASITEMQSADDAPVISIVNSIISQAIKERASDIHVEPTDNNLRVRYRIDGELREAFSFPIKTHALLISRLKIMSELDIAEKRLLQDGRINFREGDREIDIRVSSLPTVIGEKIVLRILDRASVIVDIKRLGFAEKNLAVYKKLYSQSYGMILVTGPTGSGKTTTLYSTLTGLNKPTKNIITVEDPTEYRLDGINQVQVNAKAGLTFAAGLRSILRQDPNIIMVGEIRDGETADIAIRAALTGHLVLSTLHTNDSIGAVSRLVDMGVEPFLVASSVLGILAQRLVRKICPECKESYVLETDSPERAFFGEHYQDGTTLYRGAGCPSCANTGYRGRMAIHEVFPISKGLRELITEKASGEKLKALAAQEGMTTMQYDGFQKVLVGETTINEIMRVAYAEL